MRPAPGSTTSSWRARPILRKLAAALLAASLLVPVAATPALASHSDNCAEASPDPRVTGETLIAIGSKISGVVATTQQLGLAEGCYDTTGLDLTSVTSYWVAIQPYPAIYNSIIQVGAAWCSPEPNIGWGSVGNDDICDTNNSGTWRFFYAYGGCNANLPWPRDLGPMNWSSIHEFKILVGTTIGFYVNGVRLASIPYSEMSCWDANDDQGIVSCETHDVADSCGGFAGNPVRFSNIRQRRADLTYATFQQVADPCTNIGHGTHRCDTTWSGGTNRVDFFTIQ